MRIVICCGSRDVTRSDKTSSNLDPFECWQAFEKRLRGLPRDTVILDGSARGADSIAHEVAKFLGFKTKRMRANWQKYGNAAGPIRNRKMLDTNPERVIAFWDGRSRGTKDMIDEACRRGIPVDLIE